MTTLQIDYPEDIVPPETMSKDDLEHLAQEALLVRLYELGHVSSGQAADVLHISRRAFLDLLGRYNISYFDSTMDVALEAHHA